MRSVGFFNAMFVLIFGILILYGHLIDGWQRWVCGSGLVAFGLVILVPAFILAIKTFVKR